MKASGKKVRYAVVGLGHIAQVAMLPAFRHARNSELAVLISGTPIKQRKLSRKYGVPSFHYYDFEEALRAEAVEAVYIALPNSQHREYCERAAKAGMHVLCEKPMATNEADGRAMIAAAERAGVHLMVAYRLHFAPAHVEAVALARSGKLGELRYFSSIFGMQVKGDNIRTDEKDGGGPLFDLGVYCINAARYLFDDEPIEVSACTEKPPRDKRFAQVEEMTTALLRFPRNRLAQFTCSFNSVDVAALELVGTKGMLRIDPAYGYVDELAWTLRIGEGERKRTFAPSDQFAPQLVHFSECIRTGVKPEPDGHEGLADVRVIASLFESARSRRAVSIKPVRPQRRIRESQGMKRPAIKKPRLVNAKPSSR